jgi:diguanylate cyclase (GGDEF)-like protein
VNPFGLLVAAGYGAGLLASGLDRMVGAWAVIAVATWTLGAVLGRASGRLREQVATDALTGALNRGGLEDAAGRALDRARRRSEALAVAALDLDAFKAVNDREGHAVGDRLLAETATAWRGVLRSEDVLARTGGDEFVLLMPGTTSEQAQEVLARLRSAHPARWSAGVATLRQGEPLDAALRRADERLYAAKAARGRGAGGTSH